MGEKQPDAKSIKISVHNESIDEDILLTEKLEEHS